MSIAKLSPTRYKLDVSFWRVLRREFDDRQRTVFVVVGAWPSREMFQSGADPLVTESLSEGLDYATLNGATMRQTVQYLIANAPIFVGATET